MSADDTFQAQCALRGVGTSLGQGYARHIISMVKWLTLHGCLVALASSASDPRGATRNEFARQGLTSCCSYCRMRKSGAENAGKVRDMEKYAKDHDGCKQCGAKEEFGKPKIRGLAKTDGASITS